ncbi:MAG: ATPase, T2SS/T4P/T4SS family [Bdellovibrionota bacterium]
MTTPSWLANLLSDESITDICLNGHESAFVDRGQGLERANPEPWSNNETPQETNEGLKTWVLEQLAIIGKTWDAKYPFVDAALPSGHRLNVAFPPLARQGVLVSIRRLPNTKQASGDSQKTQRRWSSSPLFNILSGAAIRGESILISGATGSGKTTLANDLLELVPHNERILALEDTPELRPDHPHFVSLTSRPPNSDGFGEVTLRILLKQSLRMRPDRIILGECRGAEILDLLQLLNTGHRGSMATIHANSPRDALRRVELLCLLSASGAIPVTVIRELLAVGIKWVVQVVRSGTSREISQLWQIDGREGDTILMRPIQQKTLHSLGCSLISV